MLRRSMGTFVGRGAALAAAARASDARLAHEDRRARRAAAPRAASSEPDRRRQREQRRRRTRVAASGARRLATSSDRAVAAPRAAGSWTSGCTGAGWSRGPRAWVRGTRARARGVPASPLRRRRSRPCARARPTSSRSGALGPGFQVPGQDALVPRACASARRRECSSSNSFSPGRRPVNTISMSSPSRSPARRIELARQVQDAHLLAHVEQEHFAAAAHRARLQHQPHRLGDGHEVAPHLGVRHGDAARRAGSGAGTAGSPSRRCRARCRSAPRRSASRCAARRSAAASRRRAWSRP